MDLRQGLILVTWVAVISVGACKEDLFSASEFTQQCRSHVPSLVAEKGTCTQQYILCCAIGKGIRRVCSNGHVFEQVSGRCKLSADCRLNPAPHSTQDLPSKTDLQLCEQLLSHERSASRRLAQGTSRTTAATAPCTCAPAAPSGGACQAPHVPVLLHASTPGGKQDALSVVQCLPPPSYDALTRMVNFQMCMRPACFGNSAPLDSPENSMAPGTQLSATLPWTNVQGGSQLPRGTQVHAQLLHPDFIFEDVALKIRAAKGDKKMSGKARLDGMDVWKEGEVHEVLTDSLEGMSLWLSATVPPPTQYGQQAWEGGLITLLVTPEDEPLPAIADDSLPATKSLSKSSSASTATGSAFAKAQSKQQQPTITTTYTTTALINGFFPGTQEQLHDLGSALGYQAITAVTSWTVKFTLMMNATGATHACSSSAGSLTSQGRHVAASVLRVDPDAVQVQCTLHTNAGGVAAQGSLASPSGGAGAAASNATAKQQGEGCRGDTPGSGCVVFLVASAVLPGPDADSATEGAAHGGASKSCLLCADEPGRDGSHAAKAAPHSSQDGADGSDADANAGSLSPLMALQVQLEASCALQPPCMGVFSPVVVHTTAVEVVVPLWAAVVPRQRQGGKGRAGVGCVGAHCPDSEATIWEATCLAAHNGVLQRLHAFFPAHTLGHVDTPECSSPSDFVAIHKSKPLFGRSGQNVGGWLGSVNSVFVSQWGSSAYARGGDIWRSISDNWVGLCLGSVGIVVLVAGFMAHRQRRTQAAIAPAAKDGIDSSYVHISDGTADNDGRAAPISDDGATAPPSTMQRSLSAGHLSDEDDSEDGWAGGFMSLQHPTHGKGAGLQTSVFASARAAAMASIAAGSSHAGVSSAGLTLRSARNSEVAPLSPHGRSSHTSGDGEDARQHPSISLPSPSSHRRATGASTASSPHDAHTRHVQSLSVGSGALRRTSDTGGDGPSLAPGSRGGVVQALVSMVRGAVGPAQPLTDKLPLPPKPHSARTPRTSHAHASDDEEGLPLLPTSTSLTNRSGGERRSYTGDSLDNDRGGVATTLPVQSTISTPRIRTAVPVEGSKLGSREANTSFSAWVVAGQHAPGLGLTVGTVGTVGRQRAASAAAAATAPAGVWSPGQGTALAAHGGGGGTGSAGTSVGSTPGRRRSLEKREHAGEAATASARASFEGKYSKAKDVGAGGLAATKPVYMSTQQRRASAAAGAHVAQHQGEVRLSRLSTSTSVTAVTAVQLPQHQQVLSPSVATSTSASSRGQAPSAAPGLILPLSEAPSIGGRHALGALQPTAPHLMQRHSMDDPKAAALKAGAAGQQQQQQQAFHGSLFGEGAENVGPSQAEAPERSRPVRQDSWATLFGRL